MVQTQKRAAIYCRVSTEDQDCDRQLRDLQAFAERAGCEVVQVFQETASGAKNDRKQRAKVMQLARERRIDAVLVTELSRWGRSTRDVLETLEQLAGWGVSLVAQTGLDLDLSTPQGELLVTVLAGFAKFERALIVERVKSGMKAAKARGQCIGRPAIKTSDKHATRVMANIAEGRSIRWIAKDLHLSKTTVMAIKKRAIGQV